MKKFVSYLRVSTQKQGASGLGLEAQREMCKKFVEQNKGEIVQEFLDVESGTHRDRKGLWQAIDFCKKNDCGLVIAKLDRLARDVEFTFKVINTGIDIHFTDMPMVNTMILGVFASVAQYERELISSRTKVALRAKKERGEELGGATQAWREAHDAKDMLQLRSEQKKRASTKNANHLASKDVQAFLKVLRKVFPEWTNGEPSQWDWLEINTKGLNKVRIIDTMRDVQELSYGDVFKKWDFSLAEKPMQVKLATYINSVRKSVWRNMDYSINS